jgi:hypothetical protein
MHKVPWIDPPCQLRAERGRKRAFSIKDNGMVLNCAQGNHLELFQRVTGKV